MVPIGLFGVGLPLPGAVRRPARVRPARPRGRAGRTPVSARQGVSASACYENVQVVDPMGRLLPVELAVKPNVVLPSGAIVPL